MMRPLFMPKGDLEKLVDNCRHLVNRKGSSVFLSVYEESRCRIHTKFFRSPFHRRSHIIEKLLVRQASLKGLLCKTGKFCDLQQSFFAIWGCCPLLLLFEKNINHRKIAFFRCATR